MPSPGRPSATTIGRDANLIDVEVNSPTTLRIVHWSPTSPRFMRTNHRIHLIPCPRGRGGCRDSRVRHRPIHRCRQCRSPLLSFFLPLHRSPDQRQQAIGRRGDAWRLPARTSPFARSQRWTDAQKISDRSNLSLRLNPLESRPFKRTC
jgi:hypothetical protein